MQTPLSSVQWPLPLGSEYLVLDTVQGVSVFLPSYVVTEGFDVDKLNGGHQHSPIDRDCLYCL